MPIVFIDAPPGIRTEHAVANVAMDGRLQSENPKILEALKQIGAS